MTIKVDHAHHPAFVHGVVNPADVFHMIGWKPVVQSRSGVPCAERIDIGILPLSAMNGKKPLAPRLKPALAVVQRRANPSTILVLLGLLLLRPLARKPALKNAHVQSVAIRNHRLSL